MERFCELKQKEVVNICDGARLGFIADLVIDIHSGRILSIIVPAECRAWSVFGSREGYFIPWRCIRKIGDDIILVEVVAEDLLEDL